VFPLCLGGNVFGWSLDDERSFAVLDCYVGAGGNFIDTADVYGRRGPDGAGSSERIIGRWMQARGNRDELVIATKVGMAEGARGLAPETIADALTASLQRLQTDRVDLYYAHVDDEHTPLEDTLAAFAAEIDAGRVRHVGASNYGAERLREALALGGRDGLARYVALQPHYNLMERDAYEGDLQDVCEQGGLACMPYFGLARGFLTGKYRRGGPEIDSPRADGVRASYADERGWRVLESLDTVSAQTGAPVAAVALAWLRAQATVLAPIASATTPEQLGELVAAATLELSAEQLAALTAASAPS
jgi:aryl-alcohol dehydrogenase-like predicted oxidoreductase